MKRLALPTFFRAFLLTLFLTMGVLLGSGCVYRMNIQQGNFLVPDSVSQLKEGMTRSQVRFLLGTPMVPDAFDEDRWDYFYYFTSSKLKDPLKRRLTIYFVDEKVQRYENQGVPTQADLEQLERDLKKAIAETKTNEPKRTFWQRMTGRGKKAAPAPGATPPSEAEQRPDPVPPAAPLPVPAGTPSGPT